MLLAFACSNKKDADAFDTFELCWTEHHMTESFSVQQSISICCIDHPIGGQPANKVCGTTADMCKTYVTANLIPSDATAADIMAACTDYINMRGM
jgi:hypothetical protein